MMMTELWRDKLSTLNAYIDEGKFTFHSTPLRSGIKEILETLPNVSNTIEECMANRDNEGRQNLLKVKADMEQTCYRYECMNQSRKVEPFRSAFDGNNKNYFFNKKTLFEEKEYIPYSNAEKEEHRYRTGFSLIGHAVKDSLISFGKAVKKTTVTGYNYVKEKLSDEPVNQIVDDRNCYSYGKNPKITNKTYGFDDYSKRNRSNNNGSSDFEVMENNNKNSYNNSFVVHKELDSFPITQFFYQLNI